MKNKVKFGGFEEVLCIILLLIATIVTTLQVIFRFTGIDLSWTEEIARYLFVWLIYMSCAIAVREDKHIKIEALLIVLKRKGQYVVNMISDFLFLVFSLIMTIYGIDVVIKIARQNQISAAVQIPMWIPYSSLVVGFACMAYRLVQHMYTLTKEYKNPNAEDEEEIVVEVEIAENLKTEEIGGE